MQRKTFKPQKLLAMLLCVVMVVSVISIPAPAYAVTNVTLASFSGIAAPDGVRVRSDSNLNASVVKTINGGTRVYFDRYGYGQGVQDIWTGKMDYRWYGISGTNGTQWIASGIINGNPSPNPPLTAPAAHQHSYQDMYEAAHPHKEFNKCSSCGDVQWLNSNKYLASCGQCNPQQPEPSGVDAGTGQTLAEAQHEHSYQYMYEAAHPHKEFNKCSTCGDVQWLGTNRNLTECTTCNPPVIEKTGYVVNTGGVVLNFRSSPAIANNIIGTIPANATVTITGNAQNGFYPISYSGNSGYASTQYISETKPATGSDINGKFAELQKKYPDGSKWNGKYDNAWQCHGFGLLVANYISGKSARTWGRSTDVSKIKAGDLVRYNNNSQYAIYDHTIVITKVSGNTLYYVDCNGDGKDTVRWNKTITKSDLQTKVNKNRNWDDKGKGYICVRP